jgi:hypothetical protein
MIPIIVLALVFVLIIVRRIGKVRLQIWQIMAAVGAIAVLATLQITPLNALKSINPGCNLLPLRYVYCRRSAGRQRLPLISVL